MTQTTFPKMSKRRSQPLDLVHTDMCGPMHTESLGKAKYFNEFIDDHSRWCEVRFLHSKGETIEKAREVIALMENQKGVRLKCIQSDNGTEFVN